MRSPRTTERSRRGVLGLVTLALCVALPCLIGCGGETEEPAKGGKTTPKPASPAAAAPKPKASASASVAAMPSNLPPLPMREFQESDFSETDHSRDPFRSYEMIFSRDKATLKVAGQRAVLIDRFALDELKLVGIVSRGPERVLLVDPTGLGWVAKVGDYVGKAEVVHSGGPTGTDVPINWRLDRVRESDVVFVREDLSHPDIPPTTRVIALRTDEGTTPARNR